jgi:acetate kinase
MFEKSLVINCGSSSLKFAVYDLSDQKCMVKGVAEPLMGGSPKLSWKINGEKHETQLEEGADLKQALKTVASEVLRSITIDCIGHRVVHGAEEFQKPCVVTDAMLAQVEACNHLAPLHNPANLTGIRVAQEVFGDIPHVGVFDTAFHQSIPKHAFLYPIPYEYYENLGVRRYGFHGTSHNYVFNEAARLLGKPTEATSIISAHLGNGCSATAVNRGASVDTTMGLTPLEGLVMGTRSGDIDPSIHGFLCSQLGITIEEVDKILNKKSGLLGISGVSNDMRALFAGIADGNERCKLAFDVFVYRLAKSLGALRVALDACDAVVFTGGIGENNPSIRALVLERLAYLGIQVDEDANNNNGAATQGLISTQASSVKAYVIPTDEEYMIAKQTQETLQSSSL